MFFRNRKATLPTFDELTAKLRQAGFEITPDGTGAARVQRGFCAAHVHDAGNGTVRVETPGVVVGQEIGLLTDLGYQKVFTTPGGFRVPAQAGQLQALHNFTEDLREAIGEPSLYNESLGSVNEVHVYDRVRERDHGVGKRPWEN